MRKLYIKKIKNLTIPLNRSSPWILVEEYPEGRIYFQFNNYPETRRMLHGVSAWSPLTPRDVERIRSLHVCSFAEIERDLDA